MMGVHRFFASSVGRKILLAVTGALLFVFLVAHVSGNLLIFSGRDAMNDYAEWLHDHPPLLWGARIGLLVVFAVHVFLGATLQRENRAARPTAYARSGHVQLHLDARSMLLTGLLIGAYVVYHLLHFTFGVVQPANFTLEQSTAASTRHDVYGMVVAGFREPAVTLSYVVAMVLLFAHLSHGIASFFQTLGFNHERHGAPLRKLATGVAALVAAAYLSIPLAVLTGLLGE